MYGGVQEYNPVEYKAKLDRVFNRHPNINVEPMMHNERLGFQPHEKKELEREIEQGRRPHENFSKTIAHKGPNHVRELHKVTRNHNEPGYREFADDLAREFKF